MGRLVTVVLVLVVIASISAAPGYKKTKPQWSAKASDGSIGVGHVSDGKFGDGSFSIGHGGSGKGDGGHGGNHGTNSYGGPGGDSGPTRYS